MKKKVFSLMMLFLAVFGFARANELTVYDGTTTSNVVPAYVFYFDDFTKSQYVIPAEDLAVMYDGDIQSITWYTTASNIPYTSVSTVDIYVTEVASASISAFVAKADCQIVYNGTLDFVAEGAGGKCVVTFSTPYHYNGGNLLIGCENINDLGYKNIYFNGQTVTGASIGGSNGTSSDNVDPSQKNFIPKTTFAYTGGGAPIDALHVKYMDGDVEVIDALNLGVRPAGAWMEPFDFTMYTTGATYTINVLDFTPSDGMFTVAGEELPFQVVRNQDVALNMMTNGTEAGVIERQFVAITEGDRAAHIWPVTVELYAPEIPDVWEKACTQATTFPFVEVPATAHSTVLHNDYTLPFPEIPEGVDAVYKLVFDQDQMISAEVTSGENGKVALYREGFEGEGGPMASNYFAGASITSGGAAAAPYEAQLGDGTSTLGYLPMYGYYNYSISQQLYLTAELEEAGVTRADMNSISWYCTSTNNNTQDNITIWIANVDQTAVTSASPLTASMNKVFEGSCTPVVGWNEFVFNTGSFAWDGSSSILVCVQRNNGAWASGINWQVGAQNFNASAYKYSDTEGPYNMETTSYTMTTTTSRANTIFKSVGRRALPELSTSTNAPTINTQMNRDGWLSYDDGEYATSIGSQTAYDWTWATMYPASMLGSNNTLTKVAIFNTSYNVSDITIDIYQGGSTEPGTLVATKTVTPTEGWQEVTLTSPVTINPSQNLWIVLSEYGTYVLTSCNSTIANNQWVEDNGWYNIGALASQLAGYGWMMRAYVENQSTPPTPPTPPMPDPTPVTYTAGPVIEGLPVTPGTYYLVASSTTPDFEVTINAENMPCPPVEDFVFAPQPADNEDEIEPASVTLRWMVPEYATGWRLIFGSTYHPEVGHPQTIIYPEDGSFTREMANSYTVRNLWNNTNYFWRVEFNNDGCPEGVSSPIWGFTTHLNVPQGLTAADETVFDDETITLNWNAVVDRTYRMYNVYRDGVLVGHTTVNNIGNTTYTDGPLAYNMDGYHYYVTAVYDEGESAASNEVVVKVSGRGNVNGHVYEQDGTTGIAGATVTMVGQDEFGVSHTYTMTTNAQGAYSGAVYAGTYNGQAACNGYQTITEPVQGNPIAIVYNNTTSPIDYILDENFDPVCSVVAQYYPDSTDVNSPYVKVFWGCGLPGEDIIEDFETGDFSMFEWQLDGSYPWSITTNNPYEGTYCMKSGGAGVANVVSNMTVTVNIPADGIMSFFGKISSEDNWDYGYFFIDGVQKGQYTGAGSWGEKRFDITAGDHTFQWRYTKDGSVNSNDDCFYVDYINFYKRPEPVQPGWHTYCESEFNNALGSNLTTTPSWAYEYPASFLNTNYAGWNITKVSLFSDNMYSAVGGNYTCRIYVGGNEPAAGTMVSTLTVDVPSNQNAWVDWDLTTPVTVSGTDPIWVVWTANSTVSNWPAGLCGDQNDFGNWWDGGSGWEHQTYGTWTMRHWFTNRSGRSVAVATVDAAPIAVVDNNPLSSKIRTFAKGETSNDIICANPNAVKGAAIQGSSTRAFSHYRVYRTNCYNDGPYNLDNTVVLACELHDTLYIDVDWPDVAPGVYKWGVGCVYVGNRGEEIEGPITWAAPLAIDNNCRVFEGTRAPENNFKPVSGTEAIADYTPNRGNATVILTAGDVWGDGSGYQMLLDADATAYGTVIPETGALSTSCSGNDAIYAEFEYKIPTNADGNCSTSNIVINNSVSIQIPAGTYDWCITNPTPGDRIWIAASTGNVGGREDNYVFQEGMIYEFVLSMHGSNDGVDVTITNDPNPGPGPGPTPPTPGTEGLQEARESEIVWSNCLDKDMYLGENDVNITVLLNSADSPEGVTVSFENYNEGEQELYPVDDVILDETGYYAWDTFRKGNYKVTVANDGYETIIDSVGIWDATSLRYVMIEIIYGVSDLYVSRTGWAMWEGHGDPLNPTPGPGPGPGPQPGGSTFSDDFESGLGNWTLVDADADGNNWFHSSMSQTYSCYDYTGWGHNGTNGFAVSQSYTDCTYDSYDPNNFMITNQKYSITASSVLNFWADYGNDSYPDHFGVAVATVDNPTPADFTLVWEGTAKAGNAGKTQIRHDGDRYQNWRSHSVNLGAYAGQDVYIAFRHFNSYDQYEVYIDDVELTAGAKNGGDRHLEYYKVLCESIDHEPIFNINTPYNFCQVATDELVEGELYICKVAAVYSTGMSAYEECIWEYESCENYAGTVNGLEVDGTTVSWEYPGGDPTPPGPQPGENATVILTAGDVWGDGSGYQMLLDADANAFGTTIPETGALSTNCSGNEAIYAEFEYKIPTNADGNCSTQNMVMNNSVSIEIPAGTYDWCITNPTPGDRIWIAAGNGNVGGRQDNYVFEAGRTYEFTVSMFGSNDGVNVVISGGAKNMYAPLPAGEVKDIANVEPISNGSRAMWDQLAYFNGTSAGQQGVATDGNFIYTCSWQSSPAGGYTFYKYTMEGTFVEGFNIAGVTELRDLTYDGQYFYAGKGSSVLYCLDLANQALVSQVSTSCSAIRHCSYDSDRDGFWVGNWSDLMLISRTGASVQNGPTLSSAYGSGYYNGHLYLFCQGGYGDCPVYDYDIAANTLSSTPSVNLATLPGIDASSALSGGAFIGQYGNKIAFFGNVQQDPNLIGIYEIAEGTPGPGPGPTPSGDILGAMVFLNGEWEAFVPAPTNTYTFDESGEYCVRLVYNGAAQLPSNNFYYAMSCEECAVNTPGTCEPGDPIHADVLGATDQVRIWWGTEPTPPGASGWLTYGIDEPETVTIVGAGQGVPMSWGMRVPVSALGEYVNSHLTKVRFFQVDESGFSATQHGDVTANIYLGGTTPQGTPASSKTFNVPSNAFEWMDIELDNSVLIDGTQDLWVTFHSDCVTCSHPAAGMDDIAGTPDNRWAELGGQWDDLANLGLTGTMWLIQAYVDGGAKGSERLITLSGDQSAIAPAYSGNLTLNAAETVTPVMRNRASIVKYNVYRSDNANGTYVQIGEVAEAGQTLYEYFDTPETPGTYYYQVTAVYDDDCESLPAVAADDATHNYVSANVDAIGENSDKVALYPNPTKGNVTIEANGINRITVVSVLGQVVYDTEVNANVFTLNMSQFNAGMYMVRVYTESGVTVKRVTVMQ